MLDQNTDRMWYVIGAVIIGAAIILIMNSTFPQLFASIGETFQDTTDQTTEITDGIMPIQKEKVIPITTFDVLDGFYKYNNSVFTVTKGQTVMEWNTTRAVRVNVTGGTSYIKAWQSIINGPDQIIGRKYVYTLPVKNIGKHPVKVINNKEGSQIIQPGQQTTIRFIGTGDGRANLQVELHTVNSINDSVDVLLGSLELGYVAEKVGEK